MSRITFKLPSFHLFQKQAVKKRHDRLAWLIRTSIKWLKTNTFRSIPNASNINSFWEVMLLGIPHITVDRSSWLQARTTSSAPLAIAKTVPNSSSQQNLLQFKAFSFFKLLLTVKELGNFDNFFYKINVIVISSLDGKTTHRSLRLFYSNIGPDKKENLFTSRQGYFLKTF